MIVHYNESHAFHNKDLKPGFTKAAYGDSFKPTTSTLRKMFKRILDGYSWTPAYFRGNTRRNDTFIASHFLVLDLDDNTSIREALENPFIVRYAALLHSTPSSSPECYRTRVVFVLSEAVTSASAWRELAKALIAHLGLKVDDASIKPAQPYHGSTNRTEQPYVCLHARLPLTVAGGLCGPLALDEMVRDLERKARPPVTPVDPGCTRAQAYTAATLDRVTSEYLAIPGGAGLRHTPYVNLCANLIGKAKGGWPIHGVDNLLTGIGEQTDRGRGEIQDAIQWAWKNAEPDPLELPDNDPPHRSSAGQKRDLEASIHPVTLSSFPADLRVNMRYISDIDISLIEAHFPKGFRSSAMLVKSGVDTGKTELLNRVFAYLEQKLGRTPNILLVTHRRALGRNLCKRLGLFWHRDIPGDTAINASSAPHLGITYDSLWRVDGNTYDVVIIDEMAQVHPHIEGGTMRGRKPHRAYSVLKGLVERAGLFIGLDAHLSDIEVQWTKQLKPNLLAIENTHRANRGILTLHGRPETVIERAIEIIAAGGRVAIPTSIKGKSDDYHAELVKRFGEEGGLLINSDNSESPEIQQFLQDANRRAAELRWLVYSPSLGTGFSLETPFDAVLGVFMNQPLAPADFIQMMGRCRNARERACYVQDSAGNRETDANVLFSTAIQAAKETGRSVGMVATDDTLHSIQKLMSLYHAHKNAAMNDPISYFVALAQAEGYTIEYRDTESQAIRESLKATHQAVKEARKLLVMTSPAVNHLEYEIAQKSGEITKEVRAGHDRFVIEDTVGQSITEQLYHDLETVEKRKTLIRFASIWDDIAALIAADQHEVAEKHLYTARKHRVETRRFFEGFCKLVFDCTPDELPTRVINLPKADIEALIEPHIGLLMPGMVNLLKYRPSAYSDKPLPVLRYILSRFGLKLTYKVARVNGELTRLYSLDTEQWDYWYSLAMARLAHLKAQRLENGGAVAKPDLKENRDLQHNSPTFPQSNQFPRTSEDMRRAEWPKHDLSSDLAEWGISA